MRLLRQIVLLPSMPLVVAFSLPAQQQDATAFKPYTLHAYANLVQVPALILGMDFRPVEQLPKDRISIRLDSGPKFHPTRMHREGDEPIALAILIDASGDQENLLPLLAINAATAAASSLSPLDRLSVFAVDCKLIRSGLDLPATSTNMQVSVEHALAAPALHGGQGKASCAKSLRLWDAAMQAVQALSQQSGRRVLLMLTNGADRKSFTTWNTLRVYASQKSVAVFGLRDMARFRGEAGFSGPMLEAGVYFAKGVAEEDAYVELCESNGGLVFTTPAKDLTASLERLVAMVRGRYILEFPRPDDSTPGNHHIDVTVPSEPDYIATAGVSVALPDAHRSEDPTTVPSSPSPAVMGKRRILPQTP